jgi:hypothetical protein
MITVIVASRAVLPALASRPPKAVPHPPEASNRQFDRQREIKEVGDVAVDVLKKS